MTKVLFDLPDGTALFHGAQGNSQRPFTGFLVIIVLKAHSSDLLQNTVPPAFTLRGIKYLTGIAYLLRDAQSLVIVQPVRDRAFAVHIPLGSDDVCKIIIAIFESLSKAPQSLTATCRAKKRQRALKEFSSFYRDISIAKRPGYPRVFLHYSIAT